MRSVTYPLGVSLDGYIVGPDGDFGWTAPDEEVFRFVTDEIRQVGVYLLGRRLYEAMLYWETADQDPSLGDSMLEWPRSGSRSQRWCSPPRCRRCRAMPTWPPAASRRRSSGCELSRGRATSRSAARLSPPRRPRWVSNSSRPAPSDRESSTFGTAWRASRHEQGET